MGQHRKQRTARSTRRSGGTDNPPTPPPWSHRAPAPAREGPRQGVGARALEDLADVARTARRTGWSFWSEVLASADTRRIPTPAQVWAADGLPRRYATHQPTAPITTFRRRWALASSPPRQHGLPGDG